MLTKKIEEEKKEVKEEWGGWKIISDMLDNPDKNGIYPTSEAYKKLYEFVVEQKIKEIMKFMEKMQEKANTTRPNLLLNEIVNYAYDRKDDLLSNLSPNKENKNNG
jgi:hypothetical protein